MIVFAVSRFTFPTLKALLLLGGILMIVSPRHALIGLQRADARIVRLAGIAFVLYSILGLVVAERNPLSLSISAQAWVAIVKSMITGLAIGFLLSASLLHTLSKRSNLDPERRSAILNQAAGASILICLLAAGTVNGGISLSSTGVLLTDKLSEICFGACAAIVAAAFLERRSPVSRTS